MNLKFEPDSDDAEPSDNMLADVEAFLADHGVREESLEASTTALFDEKEVAEILAATWKEKRAEITKLQRSRKFTQASNIKKQFSPRSLGPQAEVQMLELWPTRTLVTRLHGSEVIQRFV